MKKTLEKLYQHQTLSKQEAYLVLQQISEGQFSELELASFLTIFNLRPITIDEMKGFRAVLLDLCLPLEFSGFDTIDIVGTGGDGKDTFNISTLACFVVAGTGNKVAKHGNYSSSSVSGASHMLAHFGYQFTNEQDKLSRYLDQTNICFLHAPLFHPAMKFVAPVRKALQVKTFFNLMGPLVNPSRPSHQVFGTYNATIARLYNYILQDDNRQYTIVNSLDGYDEVSLTASTKIYNKTGENLLQPSDFGFKKIEQNHIYGGETVEDNAKIFIQILEGKGTSAQNNVVLANAAVALQTFNPNKKLTDCVAEAQQSLMSGKAYRQFKTLMTISQ